MKRITYSLGLIMMALVFTAAIAVQKYATWQVAISEESPEIGETVTITFTADLAKDWYLYSNDFEDDLGPMLTSFIFEENGTFELVGETKAIEPKRKYDDIWDGEISYFTKQATFTQEIKILSADFLVKASVKGQVCSDATGKCVLVNEVLELSGE